MYVTGNAPIILELNRYSILVKLFIIICTIIIVREYTVTHCIITSCDKE